MTDFAPPLHSVSRLVDSGRPLTLTGPDGTWLVVMTSGCENPDCPCQNLDLTGYAAERLAGQVLERRECVVRATLDVGSGELCAGPEQPAELVAWLREVVAGRMELLRERHARIHGHRDREQWRRQDRAELCSEFMVAYHEAFPLDWDLDVTVGDRLYWAVDSYCLQPGCRCKEVAVSFFELTTGAGELGRAVVELGRWQRARFELARGPGADLALLRAAWQAFVADTEQRDLLRERRREMRRVATELGREARREAGRETGQALGPAGTPAAPPGDRAACAESARGGTAGPGRAGRVGRNDPCPCGSGLKYKRCCLRRT